MGRGSSEGASRMTASASARPTPPEPAIPWAQHPVATNAPATPGSSPTTKWPSGVYVGTQPKTATQAAAAIREEYAKLARSGLAGAALAEAKQQTQGQLMLSLESPSARMYRLAGFPIHGEPYQSLDQVLAAVGGLTEEEMATVATEFFDPARQTVVWLGKD